MSFHLTLKHYHLFDQSARGKAEALHICYSGLTPLNRVVNIISLHWWYWALTPLETFWVTWRISVYFVQVTLKRQGRVSYTYIQSKSCSPIHLFQQLILCACALQLAGWMMLQVKVKVKSIVPLAISSNFLTQRFSSHQSNQQSWRTLWKLEGSAKKK